MTSNVIVVGVDGSDGARRALRWALYEAAITGAVVHAVTAWTWEGNETTAPAPLPSVDTRTQADRLAAREVATAIDAHGGRPHIQVEVIEGRPSRVLTEAAASARLLVLGSHGHSRLYHAVLGSVSAECIRAATCPVVVVPEPMDRRRQQALSAGSEEHGHRS
jgi:nucleotide-binding universal stress UspA family protein